MKKTKAEKLLQALDVTNAIVPEQAITWKVYEGDSLVDSKTIYDYAIAFHKTGELMPIPKANLGLDIYTLTYITYDETEDTEQKQYEVKIEGIVRKFKDFAPKA